MGSQAPARPPARHCVNVSSYQCSTHTAGSKLLVGKDMNGGAEGQHEHPAMPTVNGATLGLRLPPTGVGRDRLSQNSIVPWPCHPRAAPSIPPRPHACAHLDCSTKGSCLACSVVARFPLLATPRCRHEHTQLLIGVQHCRFSLWLPVESLPCVYMDMCMAACMAEMMVADIRTWCKEDQTKETTLGR